jgi:hypothetical protein
MSVPVASINFHLGYNAEEDRLLLSVDVATDQEYAMALTRRLAKALVTALVERVTKGREESLGENAALRDTVLSFEHANAVADAQATGARRSRTEQKPLVAAPRLIREIKMKPTAEGGVALQLDDRERALNIDFTAERLHSFVAGILDVASGAGWDLPAPAAWLDREAAAARPASVLH